MTPPNNKRLQVLLLAHRGSSVVPDPRPGGILTKSDIGGKGAQCLELPLVAPLTVALVSPLDVKPTWACGWGCDRGNLRRPRERTRSEVARPAQIGTPHGQDPGKWVMATRPFGVPAADVLRAQGNLVAALERYRAALAIAQHETKADPENTQWQYNLGINNERIGDILVAQGDLDAALHYYRATNDIISRLAKDDPRNAEWQHDHSVSLEKVGTVLEEQGDLPAALESFQASLVIRERLANANPGNIEWQRRLALSYCVTATLLETLGERQGALDGFRKGREIIRSLTELVSPDEALQKGLEWVDAQISRLCVSMEKARLSLGGTRAEE